MNYSVDWTDDARDGLATIWLQSTDRQAVTAASATIDRLLAQDPLGNSVPVSEGLYAIEVSPLAALFEIDDTTLSVTVVSVGRLP
jgi:hypothetical protein